MWEPASPIPNPLAIQLGLHVVPEARGTGVERPGFGITAGVFTNGPGVWNPTT